MGTGTYKLNGVGQAEVAEGHAGGARDVLRLDARVAVGALHRRHPLREGLLLLVGGVLSATSRCWLLLLVLGCGATVVLLCCGVLCVCHSCFLIAVS